MKHRALRCVARGDLRAIQATCRFAQTYMRKILPKKRQRDEMSFIISSIIQKHFFLKYEGGRTDLSKFLLCNLQVTRTITTTELSSVWTVSSSAFVSYHSNTVGMNSVSSLRFRATAPGAVTSRAWWMLHRRLCCLPSLCRVLLVERAPWKPSASRRDGRAN